PDGAFSYCTNLTGLYFKGNAPDLGLNEFGGFTFGADNAIVYYLPGTTGWKSALGGRPAVLWNPDALTSDPNFGVRAGQFGFTITGSSNLVVVVEASADLANPVWIPVVTNTLTGGSSYFSDPQWTNYPSRIYRLRSQ
ncbi:MAG: Cell surface protein, partial [Verrucomicrobiales bacterium]|nr:Cell surface protein [Verrucomicrobiales bacterium]